MVQVMMAFNSHYVVPCNGNRYMTYIDGSIGIKGIGPPLLRLQTTTHTPFILNLRTSGRHSAEIHSQSKASTKTILRTLWLESTGDGEGLGCARKKAATLRRGVATPSEQPRATACTCSPTHAPAREGVSGDLLRWRLHRPSRREEGGRPGWREVFGFPAQQDGPGSSSSGSWRRFPAVWSWSWLAVYGGGNERDGAGGLMVSDGVNK
nr:hypothetical protein Iba_chr04aCG16080 [Ipomoea batatas]